MADLPRNTLLIPWWVRVSNQLPPKVFCRIQEGSAGSMGNLVHTLGAEHSVRVSLCYTRRLDRRLHFGVQTSHARCFNRALSMYKHKHVLCTIWIGSAFK